MINDYLEMRNAEGMPKLLDTTMATAFLLNAKNEELSNLMIRKGWLHPVNLEKQFQMDLESSNTASQIAGMDLFPGDTSRLGTFATPYK